MKRTIRLTVAVAVMALLCGLLGASQIAAVPPAQEVLGSISGTVYDADGITPIANMAVDIEGGGLGTCTDEFGHYTLSGLPVSTPEWPVSYNVVAGAYDCDPDHLFAQETSWAIQPTEDNPHVVGNDFMLEQAGTTNSLSGTVWETDGVTPIADMGISVELPTGDEVRTCTDASGHYHLSGLPPGRSRIRAYHHDCSDHTYLRVGKSVRIRESDPYLNATANFWMELGGSISGTVYEADGVTPAVHVPVDIEEGGYLSCTDENGQYELRTLELGTYNVVAGRGYCEQLGVGLHSYAQDTAFGVVIDEIEPKATVDFALDPGGFIVGTIRDASGHPILNIGVGTEMGGFGDCTDGSGYYAVGGLPLGTYAVVAGLDLCAPYCFHQQTVAGVEVTVGDPYTIDFTLLPRDPGATRYVDGTPGGDAVDCQDPNWPCESIGYAVDQAANCDAILVAEGTYLENLEIGDKTLMLRGGYTINEEGQWLPGTGETIVHGGSVDRTIFIHGSNSVLEDLTITGGQTPEDECWAAGVYATEGFVTIRSSLIRNNSAECGGGGIGVNLDWGEASLVVEDSVVRDNYAGQNGGGLGLEVFYAEVINTVIVNNSAGERGAGLEVAGYNVNLRNVVISNNTSPVASALSIDESDVILQNCTISDNDPSAEEAVLLVAPHPATLTLRNTIMWNNGLNIRIGEGLGYERRIVDASFSDIEGGGWPGTGNIDADPLFVDATTGDYRLSGGSPAIDAGDNSAVPAHVTTDLEGNPRIADCTVDMGAFESIGEPSSSPPEVGPITAPLEPVQMNTEISVSAHFTDRDVGETHTAEWDWGDDTTSAGQVDQEGDSVAGTHTYTRAGVYTVRLTVQDALCSGESIFRYVVVYDPEGGIGFVTGGGWIDSPEGAYMPDPSLTGKATFGFVSKYKKGASVPAGQTEFQFHVADLNFHSTSYQWLVVGGPRAQFKGAGTINGAGDYGFMLTAVDAALTPSQDVDLFRIKIWDRTTDQVVYDNQPGDYDGAVLTTQIAGGNIVIHN